MVKVRIDATGFITHVSEEYYERYKEEGISLCVEEEVKEVPKKRTRRVKKKEE